MIKKIFSASVLIMIALLSGSSCMKKPSTDVVYGEQASDETIDATLADVLGPDTGHLALQNEFVGKELTQSYRDSTAITLLQEDGISITKKEDADPYINLTVVTSTVKHNMDGTHTPQVDRTSVGTFCKNGLTPSSQCKDPFPTQFAICKSPDSNGNKITCHDLQVNRSVIDPPAAVRAQDNCGGVPNCKLNVTEVSFDRVTWDTPEGTKVNFRFMVAPNVPYLAKELQFCQTLSVPVQNQRVLVTQCSSVVNFRYGTP